MTLFYSAASTLLDAEVSTSQGQVETLQNVFRVEIAFAFSAKLELQSFLLIDLYCYRLLRFVNPVLK